MPRDQSRNLVFIHIPKNAGKFVEDRYGLSAFPGRGGNQPGRSTIGKATSLLSLLDGPSQFKAIERLAGVVDVGLCAQHLTLMEMQLLGYLARDLASLQILATIRNPYTRMISVYLNQSTGYDKYLPVSQENFERFAEYWPLEIGSKQVLRDYPRERKHDKLAFRRKQVDFLRDIDGKIPSNIFLARVESLYDDLHSFERETGISPMLSATQNAQGSARGKHLFLSDRVKTAVREHYKEDFEILGYTP